MPGETLRSLSCELRLSGAVIAQWQGAARTSELCELQAAGGHKQKAGDPELARQNRQAISGEQPCAGLRLRADTALQSVCSVPMQP